MTIMSFDEYDRDLEEEIREGFGSLEEELMYESTSVRSNPETSGPRLSERNQAVLGFERQWWKYSGAKEAAIRELFDMSATRYYQLINSLIDTPEALEFDPMMVKRLRRMRSSRQASRSANRSNIS
ncbi:MAG: DUF3263 domain-containing protein [Candidatus Nanopelagicales bacterium]|nr:DUF3263 domain-containing protein [Candidatus Nanopelagicales bacterium]